MKLYLYIALFLLILIFIKFPISIRVQFANKELKIFIYKILISSNVSKADLSERKHRKLKKSTERIIKTILKRRKLVVKTLLQKLLRIKYKINLKLFLTLDFGLEDSALTAILYGYSNIIASTTYIILTKFFRIKKFNLDINPKFNKNTLVADFKCIINVNIVNIITMLIITLRSFEKVKKIKDGE